MPGFQNFSLDLAEEFLSGGTPASGRNLERLASAFRRAFLHYTPQVPDRWSHPRGTWTDHPDQPECGASVMLALFAAHAAGKSTADTDSLIQPYHEFLAAMLPSFSPEQASFAELSARLGAVFFPWEKHYPILVNAFRKTAVRPGTDLWRRMRTDAVRIRPELEGDLR